MNHFNRRGQSLVEMALLLPFFLTVVMGVVEYSNMFMTALRASNLSREIANVSFRDCALLSTATMPACLSADVVRVSRDASELLEDFANRGTASVSAYVRDPALNPPIRLVSRQAAGAGGYGTRFNVNTVDPAVIANHTRVVISEVTFPYTPITPLTNFLTLFNIQPVIYEVTIY